MYNYLSAHVKDKAMGQRWRREDVRALPVFSILNTYYGVKLTLTSNAVDKPLTVDLRDVKDQLRNQPESLTVEQWLLQLGDNSLPHVEGEVKEKVSTVKFNTSTALGFKAELSFTGGSPTAQVDDSEKNDIMLTKAGVDYDRYYRNSLVTVNGFVHRHDADVLGLYIKDAGKTFRKQQSNKIGILDFSEVGELDFFSIDADMVLPNPHTEKLIDGAYIELPEAIGNRVPFLVIGGYLHVVNADYYQVGDNVIKIDLDRIPLLKRLYESRDEIDISVATDLLDAVSFNESLVAVEQLHGNEFLRSYLTMRNSFVVLVNAENIYLERHKLGYTRLPGRYFDGRKPQWPLSLELGRLPEYIAFKESAVWTLAVQDNLSTRYLFETYGWKENRLVDATVKTPNPSYYSQGYLLEIGTSTMVEA